MPRNMRVKLNSITFNNVLWAKIEDHTLIMSQKTLLEGVKEVRVPNVKAEEIQFMDNKTMIL